MFRGVFAFLLLFLAQAGVRAQSRISINSDNTVQRTAGLTSGLPRQVKFNGVLTDGGSRPIFGTVPVTFSIYASQNDQKALWQEVQQVTADPAGAFGVLLGGATSDGLPRDLFSGDGPRWLGVRAEGQPEQPRILLVSVPYALRAGDAETLNGTPASQFVQWKDLATAPITGAPGSGSVAPAMKSTTTAVSSVTTSTDPQNFLPKFVDAATFTQSSIFDNSGKVGINNLAPAAVLHITGDGTAELINLEGSADANIGLSFLNPAQSWQMALRQDLDESLVIRNKTDNADVVQISKSGDVKLLAADGGIVFPDGSRQTTAAQIVVEETNTPNSVVERDSHGDISVNNANLQSNLQLPISGYIATPDAIDQNVRVIPKLFLSAGGGPSSGVIPSLTFRSTNPSHMFGEVAFQDNTPSPGQDIWAMQQDFLMNHTESLTFRRRGQEVMQFFPLGPQGSNVLTTFSGTRVRFERSGPYPIEFRDTSFAAPNGLWRMFTSQDCWFLDKNTAVAGDFSSHNPVLQTCADGTLVTPGVRINSQLVANNDLSVSSGGNIMLTSAPGRNIRFVSGAANLFNAPIAIGTSTPSAKIHVASGGNLQEAIFESQFNANEGISIRNSAQNWAVGVRADLGQAFNLRSITTGVDAMLLTPAGAVTVPNGQLTAAKGVSVGKSVDGNGGGLKHGRVAVPSVAAGANLTVELVWKTAFADASYTPTCNAVSDGAGTAALRLHHLQTILPNKVVAVLINDDSAQAHTGSLDCMAMHD